MQTLVDMPRKMRACSRARFGLINEGPNRVIPEMVIVSHFPFLPSQRRDTLSLPTTEVRRMSWKL
jgi:hypothetical protein